MLGDVALMPGRQDRLHLRKIFVQRRSPDPRRIGDLRHRHRAETAFLNQLHGGGHDRFPHRVPVRVNGVGPEPGDDGHRVSRQRS